MIGRTNFGFRREPWWLFPATGFVGAGVFVLAVLTAVNAVLRGDWSEVGTALWLLWLVGSFRWVMRRSDGWYRNDPVTALKETPQ